MKRTLLATLFSIFTLLAFSHVGTPASDGSYPTLPASKFQPPTISIYPNPATNYISIDNDQTVKSIKIFNLVGRKLKSFDNIQKNEQYDISTLPNGMYLVQVIDQSNKVITTQRISKR